MKQSIAIYFGEFLGTFILVFFGTAIVAVSVLFNAPVGLVQIAIVWGIGVTLAIYATRHLSCAHLNPAVSLGMVLVGRMQPRLLLPYWSNPLLLPANVNPAVRAHPPPGYPLRRDEW